MISKTIVYIIDAEKYFEGVINILSKDVVGNDIIYVTTNKPYGHLIRTLEKNGVKTDRIFFVDCISKYVGEVQDNKDNCLFVDSPHSLTDMVIAVGVRLKSVEHKVEKKILILDSLSTLLLYNDAKTVGQFSNFVINKMRQFNVDTIILALDTDMKTDIVRSIQSFADEIKKY
ncbi:MAG: hypothetical protein NTU61_06065 [Candidatus Altiarchaeota archaeon]|nr:hypothetical protein [Candidatus Altiarchaeota archaeon]